ncbi:coiled-coil and C2 domain-containing protein 1-like isoform X2 [Cylas formicarius]|uniref:coiled-coil and C2 domain-containing protein 1-like isoform X2 n=1 Tax=Cylas formicarius TaxID=197179 RepID=UPI002958516A|nr:coiled-coil and C2 domain-containing protein 1-like isoform X2 [Cylas formicarius]
MFTKKKPERPKRNHQGKNLAQYGLFDIPQDFNAIGKDQDAEDGSDSDLEAELAALSGSTGLNKPKKGLKQPLPQRELDSIIANTLKDIPSDDEDIEVDENDPDLLSELREIAGEDEEKSILESLLPSAISSDSSSNSIAILSERLKNYQIAESNARAAGESSKARRYGRAIKTLDDLIKQASAGKSINLEDESVPPEIHVTSNPPTNNGTVDAKVLVPIRPAPTVPATEPQQQAPILPDAVQKNVEEVKKDIDQEMLNMLLERQKEYKLAALHAKKSGNTETAISFIKVSKQFDHVIEAVKNGQPVDLSDMPTSPAEAESSKVQTEHNEIQKQSNPKNLVSQIEANMPEEQLITAPTAEEALQQRLQVYKDHETKAKDEGNSSKARRYGRIVKQYEQAIKAYKAGKPIAYDELPTPPGYGPIPGQPTAAPEPMASPSSQSSEKETDEVSPTQPLKPSPSSRISGNKVSTSHQEKQILILQAKQKQFKAAALNAKKKGEIVQAKEFLRQAKGFDKLIEAAQAGLPVDWSSIPVSPEAKSQLDNEYDIVMSEECTEDDNSDSDVLSRLEIQLTKQLKMCLSTRDHHKALGDVAGTNRFERLALNVTKDLDTIRLAKKTASGIPKFHYEMKNFSIVKSFTDLTDNDLELVIMRGINYTSSNPKEIDTYVKFDFPFPQDTPFSDRTSTIRDTNNPEYNQTFVIPIQRNSRQCQRVFKRHGIKFEVYAKGGWFKGDSLIGTVNLKLQPLETQCEIHDSFDLLEGRKKVGGKLEVRLRIRHPIVTQQVEQINEKWLIVDQ